MYQLDYDFSIQRKMTAEVKCGNCIYMPDDNRCHRNPPLPTHDGKAFFVEVDVENDFCGEFKSVKKYEMDY